MPGLVYGDRVQETTTTTGTGALSLGGAVSGYQTFSSVATNGQQVYYAVYDGASNWEIGRGVYNSSGDTLSREVVFASSNSGSLVSFGSGSKNVWLDQPAATIADKAMVVAMVGRLAGI